jgi:hypothetical protein
VRRRPISAQVRTGSRSISGEVHSAEIRAALMISRHLSISAFWKVGGLRANRANATRHVSFECFTVSYFRSSIVAADRTPDGVSPKRRRNTRLK